MDLVAEASLVNVDNFFPAKVLYVGALGNGATSLHRMEAMQRLGCKVFPINMDAHPVLTLYQRVIGGLMRRAGYPIDYANVNELILKSVKENLPDLIWIDKVLTVNPAVLSKVKNHYPSIKIVGYSPDDMGNKQNQSRYFLKNLGYYDSYFTTKTFNVSELKILGANNPHFIGNAFDPQSHYPISMPQSDRQILGGQVGFIGAWELDRGNQILALADAGVQVRWWGWQGNKSWANKHPNLRMENKPLWGSKYRAAINSFDINLCFLRKVNRDLQTTRSIEIPACGGFMLAERTEEHKQLFLEGVEAEFFSNASELIDKVQFYLRRPELRIRIANAGRLRCLTSGYSNDDRIRTMFNYLNEKI